MPVGTKSDYKKIEKATTDPIFSTKVDVDDWKELISAQLQMQQRILDMQQIMIRNLAEQSNKTNTTLKKLVTQIRILQTHVVSNSQRAKDKNDSQTFAPDVIAQQLRTLQASILWTQRNVRLVKSQINNQQFRRGEKNPLVTKDVQNRVQELRNREEENPLVTEDVQRVQELQNRLIDLEGKSFRMADASLALKIVQQNAALNAKLSTHQPTKAVDLVFLQNPASPGAHTKGTNSLHKRANFRVAGADAKDAEENGPPESPSKREILAKKRLLERKDAWTSIRTLQVMCATWNCNARKPSEDLGNWLSSLKDSSPHIIVIGLQEVVALSVKHVLLDQVRRMKPWEEAISLAINGQKGNNYTQLLSKQMVGIMIFIYVRQDILGFISNKDTTTVGCGKAGAGNKGAVCARFQLFNSSLCFVNSHLAAHKENIDNRNNDFNKITEKARFSVKTNGNSTKMDMHDAIFWMGDLNYRLNFANEDLGVVYQHIQNEDWEILLEQDQLKAERIKGRVFENFQEGDITFPPTFKYIPDTNQYATGDGKNRMPAWCDRILWRAQNAEVRQRWYRREESLMASDHKPVVAYFDVSLRVTDPDKQAKVFEEISSKITDSSLESTR
ncbi:hypothetical protein AAMO2058_000894900 [Amorphochlora amoebiformis]